MSHAELARVLVGIDWDFSQTIRDNVMESLSGVKGELSPLAVGGRRATRLDLARWLAAPDHPLVARVFVNRLWKLLFGQGLVKTLDDFGSQGAPPTHPELLDWLAVEFRESGWDIKHMMKLIVMSNTYRQSSAASEALRQRDPYNSLLARQGRFRFDAEMVRDNALAASGLLSTKMLGPSTKPYQPPLYWAYLNFPQREWQADHGENLYRRGVYTYWCRTFLHPSLLAFDAPTREECCVERPRSNTPLQALVLLNDPEYVEAARAFAERILREGGSSTEERIRFAFRQTLNRKPQRQEVDVLSTLHDRHLAQSITSKAFPCGWPAAASKAASPTARPTTSATTPSRMSSMCTICTLRFSTSWASITSG
jgi:hypothetical protein